jgi:N-glycosidase YbiA
VPQKHRRARQTLVVAEDKPAAPPIDAFTGPHFFLSNFSESPVEFEGDLYPTVEHAYAAAKTQEPDERERIRFATTPGEARRIGRQITLRSGWDDVRVEVMRDLLAKKFAAGSELALKLQATGSAELREGNTWGDRFWGVCRGQGRNQLGQLLTQRRNELRRDDPARPKR